tara:strand:- start:6814 stop:7998 length:1185 start_codon:yes stop_codon:yes gene_type:complete
MVSRSARVGQAFGSKGVLNNAAKSVVEEVGGGGVEEASNDSAALGTGTAGALKFATNRKTLHMYDGNEWDRIAGGTDAAPVITEDAQAITIAALDIDSARQTFKVQDPEGFPISYSISYMRDSDKVFFGNESSNLPPLLAHPTIITKASDGTATYKFFNRQTESDGSGYTTKDIYKVRYMGSDGARHAVSTKDIKLAFSVDVTFTPGGVIQSSTGWGNGTNVNQVTAAVSASSASAVADGTNPVLPLGKKYFEWYIDPSSPGVTYAMIGVHIGDYTNGYSGSAGNFIYAANGTRYPGGSGTGHSSFGTGTTIGIAYDTDQAGGGGVWFSINGTWGSRDPNTGSGDGFGSSQSNVNTVGYRPAIHWGSSSGSTVRAQFRRGDTLTYSPPTGFSSV